MTLHCLYSSPQAILKSSQIVTGHFVTLIAFAHASSSLQSWTYLEISKAYFNRQEALRNLYESEAKIFQSDTEVESNCDGTHCDDYYNCVCI